MYAGAGQTDGRQSEEMQERRFPYHHAQDGGQYQGWKKRKISLEYGQKLHYKCEFFTHFQNFFVKKKTKKSI